MSRFYADLHIHSKYSRATSRNCDLPHLAVAAQRKGLRVIGTGDFTHPQWSQELGEQLQEAAPGLYQLTPAAYQDASVDVPESCRGSVSFILQGEISTIYKRDGATRKVHHIVFAPDLETVGRINKRLGAIGNIRSDGRPILGLDSRNLLEIILEANSNAFIIPAHIWTPWFSVLGSKSGFDSIEACYGDLSDEIFALETGLSSDPPMNWRVSSLDRYTLVSNSDAHSPAKLAREANIFECEADYFSMRQALRTREGFHGTVEFYPEEGKYHLDGHRKCGECLTPEETQSRNGLCSVCGKPVTVGVLHRVADLADRPEGGRPERVQPFYQRTPLAALLSGLLGKGENTKTVSRALEQALQRCGSELFMLNDCPIADLETAGVDGLAEAIEDLREGRVILDAGYDGEFGRVRIANRP